MDSSRRTFLATTAALAASRLAGSAETGSWDGHKPLTKPELDALAADIGRRSPYTCVRRLEQNEGPYYYESSLLRRDITEGRKGVPLRLGVRVVNASGSPSSCAPLRGAVVDVWHADADGMYSNVGGDLQMVDARGQTFMRGHQVTDANGYAEFETVVPGWELAPIGPAPGAVVRTTHIHVKVFHEHQIATAQLFLPDALLDELYASVNPYASHRQMRVPGADRLFDRIHNTDDGLFKADHSTPLPIQRQGGGVVAQAAFGIVSMGTRGVPSLFR